MAYHNSLLTHHKRTCHHFNAKPTIIMRHQVRKNRQNRTPNITISKQQQKCPEYILIVRCFIYKNFVVVDKILGISFNCSFCDIHDSVVRSREFMLYIIGILLLLCFVLFSGLHCNTMHCTGQTFSSYFCFLFKQIQEKKTFISFVTCSIFVLRSPNTHGIPKQVPRRRGLTLV